uniref:Uncharacterized protein n=1 Tax=Timema douglasi TaxID=61478 RepID=A0A7R8VS40_TIMDO|nr:unnamed protein product [Timema douglasi]
MLGGCCRSDWSCLTIDLPIVPTITRQLEKMKKGSGRSNKPKTKDTWKGRQLLRRQKETLAEVQRIKLVEKS